MARWGGDEFIDILVDIDQEMSASISGNIRQRVERLHVMAGDDVVKLTVSIGAAISTDKDDSVDAIINRADSLLYKAKQSGRNCIQLDLAK